MAPTEFVPVRRAAKDVIEVPLADHAKAVQQFVFELLHHPLDVRLVGTGAKMVLPHNSVCRMTREQSRRVLRWNPADPVPGKLYRNQRMRACPGGLWVVHADLFERHWMDERFEGWGCEDTEFLRRIPWRRLPGPLFHIWHAKASKARFERNRWLLRVARR